MLSMWLRLVLRMRWQTDRYLWLRDLLHGLWAFSQYMCGRAALGLVAVGQLSSMAAFGHAAKLPYLSRDSRVLLSKHAACCHEKMLSRPL